MKTLIGRTIGRVKQIMFQLLKFLYPHRKTAVALVCVVLIAGFFWLEPANAIFEEVGKAILWAISKIMLALSQLFIGLAVFLLKFFTELARYNGYIDTPTVVLGWLMVRDVVNMFFVVVLLIIAFGTILGIEQYEWKKTLVKFVLAAILINFSNLICGIIIDVAHVFTITFLNAVSATAGGNLINMFHLDDIYKMATKEDEFKGASQMDIEIFIAAVVAFVFAGLTLVSMLAYTLVMIARVVVLWALIILSPIAFIMQVIPLTQQYAKEWWTRFGKQVVVAPIMVFFLWLSFATLGTGSFVKEDLNMNLKESTTEAGKVTTAGRLSDLSSAEKPNRLSLSDVSTWENMANFLIATAFLIVGLGVVNKLGVVGGGVVSGLTGFGKRVATIATGYAAGRWLVGKTAEVGGRKAKETLMNLPIVGGKSWARTGKRLDEWRRQGRIIRHIPFIGGYNREYQEKMDERVERIKELQKATRMKDMSKTGEGIVSGAAVKTVNAIVNKIPGLRRLSAVDYKVNKETGKIETDEKGNPIMERKGVVGIDALTARRNFAEYQELAAVQLRSPTNRATREAANKRRLYIEGREILLKAEGEVFGQWAQEQTGGQWSGMSDADKETFREQNIAAFRADEDAQAKLSKVIEGVNHPDKWIFGKIKKDEGVYSRAGRNAAQYLATKKKLATLEEETRQEEDRAEEFLMGTDYGKNLTTRLANAEVGGKIGEEIVRKFKNAHLFKTFEKALSGLNKAAKQNIQDEWIMRRDDPVNIFARALKEAAEANDQEENTAIIKGEAESMASGVFIEDPTMGKATYSQAFVAAAKRIGDVLNRVDEKGRAEFGARSMMRLAFLRKQAKEAGEEGVSMTVEKEMYGMLNNLAENANLDDAITMIGTQIERYEKDDEYRSSLSQAEVDEIEEARRMFGAEGEFAMMQRELKQDVSFIDDDGKAVTVTDEQGNEIDARDIAQIEDDKLKGVQTIEGAYIDIDGNAVIEDGKVVTSAEGVMKSMHGDVQQFTKGAFVREDGTVILNDAGDVIDKKEDLTATDREALEAGKVKQQKEGGWYRVADRQAVRDLNNNVATTVAGALHGARKVEAVFVDQKTGETKKNKEGKLITSKEEIVSSGLAGVHRVMGAFRDTKTGDEMKDAQGNIIIDASQLTDEQRLRATKHMRKISGSRTTNMFENYMGTGGNDRLLRTHLAVEEYMNAENKARLERGEGTISYAKAAKELFTKKGQDFGSLNSGLQDRIRAYAQANKLDLTTATTSFWTAIQGSYDELRDQFDQYSSRLNDMGYAFKRYGLQVGHAQLGGHQIEDEEMGTVRMNTAIGARELMNSSIRKRSGAHRYNPHSFSDTDASNYQSQRLYLSVLEESFSPLTRVQDMSGMFKRTIEALTGQEPSKEAKKIGEYGVLGGDVEQLMSVHDGSMENFSNRIVAKWLLGPVNQLPMLLEKAFKNVQPYDAQEGIMKVIMYNKTGDGYFKADSSSEFIQKWMREYLQNPDGTDNDAAYGALIDELWTADGVRKTKEDIKKSLESAIDVFKKKEGEWRASGKGKKTEMARRDEEEEEET